MNRPVIHLLPFDAPRGAQVYARAIRDALDSHEEPHRLITLFDAPPSVLHADTSLGVPKGSLRDVGFDPRVARRLRRWVRDHQPVAAIAHGGEPFKYAALCCPSNLPLVYYRIGAVLPAARRPPGRWWHAALLRRATRVVCVSEDIRRETAELFGVPDERLDVIPNGRDPEVFSPGVSQAGEKVSIGFIGQLMASKRPGWFLDVVGQLRSEGLPVEGTVVGDGPLMEQLRAHPASSAVELLGRSLDVPGILRSLDLLILTSTVQEGMPGVLIEAGMCGLPVVATDVPGVRDVVVSGVTGLVVSPYDRHQTLDAARSLVVDVDLRRRLGQAARQHCVAHFSQDQCVEKWQIVLHSMLDEARR